MCPSQTPRISKEAQAAGEEEELKKHRELQTDLVSRTQHPRSRQKLTILPWACTKSIEDSEFEAVRIQLIHGFGYYAD